MNEKKQLEFGISEIRFDGVKAVLEGRCHRGPIMPGDIFSVLSSMTLQTTAQIVGPTKLTNPVPVSIKVDAIWAYGHKIQELSQTMTARLETSGSGFEHLKSGLALSS